MRLLDLRPGDRARLADGRVVELAWPAWAFTTPPERKKLGKSVPDSWMAREIAEDFGGAEARGEIVEFRADLGVVELVSKYSEIIDDGRGDHGGDDVLDPVTAGDRWARGGQGGLPW